MLPSDEGHPGMIQEVLDVLPSPGGEVVDDDDVVVLCQRVCKVRADEAGPAGDDVAHEESMMGGGLGLSEWGQSIQPVRKSEEALQDSQSKITC